MGLRPMQESDLDTIVAMENELQPHPWPRAGFEQALRLKQHCMVYEEDGAIKGYGIADRGHGRTIAARSMKAAGYLYRAWFEHAAQAQAVILMAEIEADNAAARARLERFGFTHAGDRPHFYGAGCPAQVWSRPVTQSSVVEITDFTA